MVSEVIYVNDGSRDDTLGALRELSRRDPRITVVDLSRNFGKEIALTAGLEHARQGDDGLEMSQTGARGGRRHGNLSLHRQTGASPRCGRMPPAQEAAQRPRWRSTTRAPAPAATRRPCLARRHEVRIAVLHLQRQVDPLAAAAFGDGLDEPPLAHHALRVDVDDEIAVTIELDVLHVRVLPAHQRFQRAVRVDDQRRGDRGRHELGGQCAGGRAGVVGVAVVRVGSQLAGPGAVRVARQHHHVAHRRRGCVALDHPEHAVSRGRIAVPLVGVEVQAAAVLVGVALQLHLRQHHPLADQLPSRTR